MIARFGSFSPGACCGWVRVLVCSLPLKVMVSKLKICASNPSANNLSYTKINYNFTCCFVKFSMSHYRKNIGLNQVSYVSDEKTTEVLKRIFVHRKEEVTGGCRGLHNKIVVGFSLCRILL